MLTKVKNFFKVAKEIIVDFFTDGRGYISAHLGKADVLEIVISGVILAIPTPFNRALMLPLRFAVIRTVTLLIDRYTGFKTVRSFTKSINNYCLYAALFLVLLMIVLFTPVELPFVLVMAFINFVSHFI